MSFHVAAVKLVFLFY